MIRTSGGHIYTGITTDIKRRLRQHNGEIKGGAKALRGKGPHTLVALWNTNSRSNASKFECYLKSLTKTDKERLILNAASPNEFKAKRIQ
ncbi:GIY-YIG nuclease family protein [Alteromonas sp. 5E99-2]|nr:GIY-YIG nuclease family protein [Alteromonas sp. 5E99-2]MBO1256556.1 GIY-YIG nuclease family protein [Alteromonas sp. 5E99-2]